ncbi:Uncharacterised protein [Mycobacteroides abscessus subsp. abscessus]|uniref:hypothetical protein n=1 Tax=Mycobacteroides abscessus TaxID=36809 RepID=UPI0009A8FC64|nr:hypothetical protein [Mycobacteroides abscessus]MBL3743437.1 hypothetical protein [Mycobacteroides abscessus subsp. massiliense]RIR58222.1 hypothetical protein D2E37_08575 [Mycobacteroides abscessus]RIS86455.1 hypothetical protein D2E53_08575 [Mycobacteroides abscessus]SKF66826.1 Uncharacterised protein [Mycobacteroides abscessus subsp. bolletii]SKF71264.1 Uncharacterised protein [Mycobacteroides abscessus subsp. bolletii]
MTEVMIDPNVRVAGGLTFSGFEDVIGDLPDHGDRVAVREPESGITGFGTVERVDFADRLIYLAVEWAALSLPIPTQRELAARLGLNTRTFSGSTSTYYTPSLCDQLTA